MTFLITFSSIYGGACVKIIKLCTFQRVLGRCENYPKIAKTHENILNENCMDFCIYPTTNKNKPQHYFYNEAMYIVYI